MTRDRLLAVAAVPLILAATGFLLQAAMAAPTTAAAAESAGGGDARVLLADPPRVDLGLQSRLQVHRCEGGFPGAPLAISPRDYNALRLVHPDGAWQPLAIGGTDAEAGLALVQLTRPGTYLALLEAREEFATLSASQLALSAAEGAGAGTEVVVEDGGAPGAPGHVATRTWMKAVLAAGLPGGSAVLQPQGLPIEAVPREDPWSLAVGGTLHLLLMVDGQPVANRRAWVLRRVAGVPRLSAAVSGADGLLEIGIDAVGLWVVGFSDTRPSAPGDVAAVDGAVPGATALLMPVEWRRRLASLTFMVQPSPLPLPSPVVGDGVDGGG